MDLGLLAPASSPGQAPLRYTLRSGVRVADSLHQNGTGPYSAHSLGLVKGSLDEHKLDKRGGKRLSWFVAVSASSLRGVTGIVSLASGCPSKSPGHRKSVSENSKFCLILQTLTAPSEGTIDPIWDLYQ